MQCFGLARRGREDRAAWQALGQVCASGTQITRDESDDDRKTGWGGGCFVLGLWSVDVLSQG